MSTYADTSFLQSHFLNDCDTDSARSWIDQALGPLLISDLGKLEFENAILRRVGVDGFSHEHARSTLSFFRRQQHEGWFATPQLKEGVLWSRSMELSANYAVKHEVRALDILHVAAALELGAKSFFTFDKRQNSLADEVGLRVIDRRLPWGEARDPAMFS